MSAAAAIASDLGLGGNNPQRVLIISRLTIVALVGASVFVAIYLPDKIFNRVLFAWMALGAAFGPTLFFRLSGVLVTAQGVILSILVGFFSTVLLSFTPNAVGDIAERLIPFTLASLCLFFLRPARA